MLLVFWGYFWFEFLIFWFEFLIFWFEFLLAKFKNCQNWLVWCCFGLKQSYLSWLYIN